MYLWIGLGIEQQEETKIRTYCKTINTGAVNEASFTLPQHISLKASFETEKHQEIIAYLKSKYRNLEKFPLEVEGIQQLPGVIWLKIKETATLRKMHNELNHELSERYAVGLTGYDGESFIFHSTLLFDPDNTVKVKELFNRMCGDRFYSKHILIDRLYFGTSPSGKAGTFTVVDDLELL